MIGTRAERIEHALGRRFAPATVMVADRSASHAGHAGNSGAGETHYDVLVVSDAFEGMGRVARQRAAQEAVASEFAAGLHALSMRLRTAAEAEAEKEAGGRRSGEGPAATGSSR